MLAKVYPFQIFVKTEKQRVVSNLFCVLPQLCLLPQKTLQVA